MKDGGRTNEGWTICGRLQGQTFKESTVIKQLHAVLIVCDCFRQSGSESEERAGGLCSTHKREVRTLNN
jgi:hypothetical protein